MKKFFLLSFLSIFLYLAFLFFNESLITQESSPPLIVEALKIEPIVISPVVKSDESEETLFQLKLAVDDAVSKENIDDEKEAEDILSILKESIPLVMIAPIINEKKIEEQSGIPIKRHVKKKLKVKKTVYKHKKHSLIRKKIIKKKIVKKAVSVKVVPTPKIIASEKRVIGLGEQNDLHYLSREERRKFHNLEVISVSNAFTLEETPAVQNPEECTGYQSKVELKDLSFVKTLGVVDVSAPSIYQDESIKR